MSEFLVEDLENGQRVVAVKSIDGTTMGNSELLAEVVVDTGDGTLQRCVAVKDFGGGSGGGLPPQEGQSGKSLYTDGEDASWKVTRDPNTYRSLSTAQATQILADGTYNGEAVTDGEIFTSADGSFEQYSATPQPPSITWSDMGTGNRVFASDGETLAYTYQGAIYKSIDKGTSWVQTATGLTDASYESATRSGSNGIFWYMNGLWILLKSDCSGAYTSTDLTNWSSVTFSFPEGANVPDQYGTVTLAHNGSVYCMGVRRGSSSYATYLSSDLVNWSNVTTAPSSAGDVISGGSVFYCHRIGGGNNLHFISKSTDNGETWTQLSKRDDWNYITYADNTLIGIDYAGNVYKSTDGGSTFTEVSAAKLGDSTQGTKTITYSNGVWVGCSSGSYSSTLKLSIDLVNWTDISSSVSPRGNGGYLISGDGVFILQAGYKGIYEVQYEYSLTPKSLSLTSDAGAPVDDTTVGILGQIYIDTTNKDAYICVEADFSVPTYTWKKITQ